MPFPLKVLLMVRIAITVGTIIAAPMTQSPLSNIYVTMLALSVMLILQVYDGPFHRILATQLNILFICRFPGCSRERGNRALDKIFLTG